MLSFLIISFFLSLSLSLFLSLFPFSALVTLASTHRQRRYSGLPLLIHIMRIFPCRQGIEICTGNTEPKVLSVIEGIELCV